VRRWPWLLIGSALLNLFLIGVIVGGAWWVRARPPAGAAGALRLNAAGLSDEQQRTIRVALRPTRRALRPVVRESRAAREEAAALLRQPRPDRTALRAALARIRAADFRVRGATEDGAVDAVAALPAAERGRIADTLLRRGGRGRRAR
jgi:uncharacterized membrane protein